MRPFIILVCLLIALPAQADDRLGSVSRVQGTATAEGGNLRRALAVGDGLLRGDVLRTGPAARLEATLTDGSVLTLGEKAALTLNDVVVPDGPPARGPVMDLLVGAFRLVAAKVADTSMAARTIRTPVATIGIRGTDVWGGPLDSALDVLLLEGAVDVTTPKGTTRLDAPGLGTQVEAAGAAPQPAVTWPASKVARAVATVSFDGD